MRLALLALAAVLSLPSVARAGDDLAPLRWKPAKIVGPADAKAIDRTLRRHRARLDFCYEQARRRDPTLRGTLIATFAVQATGRVDEVRVEGVDNALENCAARTVRSMTFPRSPAVSRVRLAITVRPPPPPKPLPAATLQSLLGACTCPCACQGQLPTGIFGDGP